MKPFFNLLRTAVPIVYCGGLLYYFIDNSGSVDDASAIGLGPTMLGLSVVGLVTAIPLIWKLYWLVMAARPKHPRDDSGDAGDDFDADAVIARHLAKAKAAAEPEPASTPPPRPRPATPSGRPTFGRKVR